MEQKQNELEPLEAMVENARDGNRSAMEELYLATYTDMWQTVRAISPNDDDAMDVMQESYLTAFTHLKKLKKPENFRAWLKSIAINEIRQRLRKKQPTLFSELSEEEITLIPEHVSTETPETLLERKEQATGIQQLLSELPDGYRTVLVLYYCEQYSVKEISQRLGISQSTVKSQLYHGRKKLEAAAEKSKNISYMGLSASALLSGWRGTQAIPAKIKTGTAIMQCVPHTAAVAAKNAGAVVLGRIAVGAATVAIVTGLVFGANALTKYLRKQSVPQPIPDPPHVEEIVKDYDTEDPNKVTLRYVSPPDSPAETEAAPATPEEPAPIETKPTVQNTVEPTEPKPSEQNRPSEPAAVTTEPGSTPENPPEPPAPGEPQLTDENPYASQADANDLLPTQSPYSFEYQEVTLPVGSVWHTSFKTDAEWQITPFVYTPHLSETRNINYSNFHDGEQCISIELHEPGEFVYSLYRSDIDLNIRLVKIIVTETEKED